MVEIQYDDGASKQLEEGNAVVFEPSEVVEQIKGSGNRRYPYKASGNTLILNVGATEVNWEIVLFEPNAMEINTPIGMYKLSR
ncbi:hypothetical protein [Halioxenophilus aromaticivorans]|uniref:hypothetical protein n=1 Tax=Halioxenophilus aromaticivorans TaxID=1306992 RepID=UPI0031EE5BD1